MAEKSVPTRINGKVIVAGPANAGKTCLIERFVNDVYAADSETHGPTLGCDCLRKSVYVDNTEVHLFLYDTAGQERFSDMASSYYRVGEVCLLCFDLSNLATFDSTKFWMKKVNDHNEKCSFILVGTKEDLLKQGADDPSLQGIAKWAEENGIPFFCTSAKRGGQAIKFLFHTVSEKCMRINHEKQLHGGDGAKGTKLSPFGQPKGGSCCA
mmetsp:Transcript_45964/g.127591  ORF Transcript_45964/g.127591 Transcript_45964/m.127591 type:complete len:211 (-) Transcript_45964:126-758(-)|eukprot:CAMPEP_0117469710 /NCGR_PEP_ID=MMETSP0784-20121206/6838_1 /TAXON_ID=39447 /ORGANISM="" /LENGTH=210 /DNA_ID=CAMNT_0005263771 /DNA_START=54 /DNA_END=686 /DNA_ORIENTATION=+